MRGRKQINYDNKLNQPREIISREAEKVIADTIFVNQVADNRISGEASITISDN